MAKIFKEWVTTDRDMAAAVAAVKSLSEVIKVSKGIYFFFVDSDVNLYQQ